MFAEWLNTQENASWDQLLEALRSPSVELMQLANKVEKMLEDEQNNYQGKDIMIRCHEKITGIDARSIAVSNGVYIFQICSYSYIATYILS